jgi:acetyl esterase/lipase
METILGPRLPELRAVLLDLSLRARMKRRQDRGAVTDASLRRAARWFDAMPQPRTPPFVRIEPAKLAGLEAEWVSTKDDAKRVILYFHGGGFFMCNPRTHRAMTWRLARSTGRRVLALDYRKAPDHAFPAWIDDGFAAYSELLAAGHRPEDILLAGDSAGGNIALSVTHRIRREGAPLPDGLVLISPWADLACEGRSYRSNKRWDAMFRADGVAATGRYLTKACDPRNPEVSPVHADFRGFPRMLLLAGSNEVFLDDARLVTRRARAAGVHAELYVYRHMPHVFPIFAGVVPRAKGAYDLVQRFAR